VTLPKSAGGSGFIETALPVRGKSAHSIPYKSDPWAKSCKIPAAAPFQPAVLGKPRVTKTVFSHLSCHFVRRGGGFRVWGARKALRAGRTGRRASSLLEDARRTILPRRRKPTDAHASFSGRA